MEENTMKKLEAYFGLCGYAVAALVGLSASLAAGSWPAALSVVALAALAFSKARAWFIYLRS